MRTAISRMLATGELAAVDGGYELRGRLLDRKQAQDIGRRPPGDAWDGIVVGRHGVRRPRTMAERREFRAA